MDALWQRGEFTLSTDPGRLNFDLVFNFLANTYWAKHRPRAIFDKAVRHSLCMGLFHGANQVGFARAITDYATFAYLADVFVLEPYRHRGLAQWMVSSLLAHPDLKALRRWMLLTEDAQELYRRCGFTQLAKPDHVMERLQPWPKKEEQTA